MDTRDQPGPARGVVRVTAAGADPARGRARAPAGPCIRPPAPDLVQARATAKVRPSLRLDPAMILFNPITVRADDPITGGPVTGFPPPASAPPGPAVTGQRGVGGAGDRTSSSESRGVGGPVGRRSGGE